MGIILNGMPKNKIKTPRCENCRYFLCDTIYKTDGICLLDNEYTRPHRVCYKLHTDNQRREAKNLNFDKMTNLKKMTKRASEELEYDKLHANEKEKGGFFDLPKIETCNNPSHNPPTHLCIPPGKGYKHICPGCGYTITLISPQVML